jgi:Flp pilus assembly protein TadG
MPKPVSRLLNRLRRDRRGNTGLELAVVAVPVLMILFGTIEIGMMICESAVVEGATREAARKVRTGAAQTSANPIATFTQAFCAALSGPYDCASFSYDVRTFSDFTTIALPAVTYDQTGKPTNAVFQPGAAGSVVTVRVIHQHSFATPLIGIAMGAGTSNSIPIIATAVFKTEPYQ